MFLKENKIVFQLPTTIFQGTCLFSGDSKKWLATGMIDDDRMITPSILILISHKIHKHIPNVLKSSNHILYLYCCYYHIGKIISNEWEDGPFFMAGRPTPTDVLYTPPRNKALLYQG